MTTTNRHRSQDASNRTVYYVSRSADGEHSDAWKLEVHDAGGLDGTRQSVDDVVTPGYSRKRAQGELIMNDFYLVKERRGYSPLSLNLVGGPDSGNYHAEWGGDFAAIVERSGLVPGELALPARFDQVLIEAYANVRGDSVMTGEILPELTRTLGMLRRPFHGASGLLRKAVKSAKRHYGKTARSIAQANSSAWLEYRYGLKPFLLDASTSVKLASQFSERLEKRRSVVRSSRTDTKTEVFAFKDAWGPTVLPLGHQLPWWLSGSARLYRKRKVSAGVIVEVSSSTPLMQLAQDYRLMGDSVVPTLWELMPYSFVVDWFVGVGSWLEAMSLPPGVKVTGNWVTTCDKQEGYYESSELRELQADTNTMAIGTWGSSFVSRETVQRVCGIPLPSHPVTVANYATVTHAADAAALATGSVLDLLAKLRH